MDGSPRTSLVSSLAVGLCLIGHSAQAKPNDHQRHELAPIQDYVDIVGDVDGVYPKPAIALQDTIWIADWTFDEGGFCTDAGWLRKDNRIRSDGLNHWAITGGGVGGDGNQDGLDFDRVGNIVGKAAVVGEHDLCWEGDGYDNDWHTGIKFEYEGGSATYLSFDYLIDSEGGFDFLQVETDSTCASFSRVDYDIDPDHGAAWLRSLEFSASGFDTSTATTSVDSLLLTDHGAGTHCAYVAFTSDAGWSPADGLHPSTVGIALAIDNIVLEGITAESEDFEDGLLNGLPNASFANIQDSTPFGEWSRVYPGVTDNDVCAENRTCAWLHTDNTTPTLATDPSMAFGPGQFVVRDWLDNIVVSPWVNLAATAGASGTVLSFRRFPGNFFRPGSIVQNWSVRGKIKVANSDTPALGDSIDCLTEWGHTFQWNSLSLFRWVTSIFDMESHFDPAAYEIQVRFRVSDWSWIAGYNCTFPCYTGPGPYWDRVRIGRRILTGPVVEEHFATGAQDAFATDPIAYSGIPNWVPSTDRFGTAAFSYGWDRAYSSPNLVFGDSITVTVHDVRGAGGVTAIDWYGAIVSGPHQSLAPPPHLAGPGGFFKVAADSSRNDAGVVNANTFFVSLDDEYFRGGDKLVYAWTATDAQGGFASDPFGLAAPPTSLAAAVAATGGLLEVSYLPTIDWDPAYVSVLQNGTGKEDPTPEQLANSSQANCILYTQAVNLRRRSGDLNRTSVMYTLDVLGYGDQYDVYDHKGLGDSNAHLGGRATVEQATGYALIIYDFGYIGLGMMPDGTGFNQKVDQSGWFQAYLAQATGSEAGIANLWVISSNAMEREPTEPLYTGEMGVVFVTGNQGLNANPDVEGQTTMTFSNGNAANFTGDLFSAKGGCPSVDDFDAMGASGTAVMTHRWKDPYSGSLGDAAIVMNVNPAAKWNTVMQSVPWFDIRDPLNGSSSPQPEEALMTKVLGAIMPAACPAGTTTTDVGDDEIDAPPLRTALYQNVPNPFNPLTTIRFDLAHDGQVELTVYDVAGGMVRTLVDDEMTAGRQHVVWNGLDESGNAVASGVYVYRFETRDFAATRKMVVIR